MIFCWGEKKNILPLHTNIIGSQKEKKVNS